MEDHLNFIFYIYLFIFSTIGHGFLLSKCIGNDFLKLNLGYQGIIGFYSLCLISMITSFFFSHNFIHNFFIHSCGLLSFIYFNLTKKNFFELKYLSILIGLFIISAYVFKTHDDFPYYHLTYSLNLSSNSFIVGTGAFSHGFRTFSSLFFYHSLLFLPGIKFYLFHIGPFFILIFFNYIILFFLRNKLKKMDIDFIYYFSILSLIFVNVVFYRISEHGTDRSAQIILLLIFIFFFSIISSQKEKNKLSLSFNLLLIFIFLASSMKAIYYLYLIVIPIILFKKKNFYKFFLKKNYFIILILFLGLVINVTINYLNTGCLLYPAEKTCIVQQEWSIDKKEVKKMATHYEWWAKAGGGPGYSSKIEREIYIKDFNWLSNWIDKHFFNKVSDTLLGIIFICFLFIFSMHYYFRKRKNKIIKFNLLFYFLPLFFLVEWFLNHPSMRYGGYVLFAIPIFLFVSNFLEKYKVDKKKLERLTLIFIILTYSVFVTRNLIRIEKEIDIYGYNLIKSPFFYIKNINSYEIYNENKFKIYSTKNNQMCWASPTPCSYSKNLKVDKFLWMNVVYKNDK